MPSHIITGVLDVRHCECRFCGRKLKHFSSDATWIECLGEHVHFTQVNTFHSKCEFCGLLHRWQIKSALEKTAPRDRLFDDYHRTVHLSE